MSIQLKIRLAGDAYRNESPRTAIALLREAADMIEAYLPRETTKIDAIDADGWADHMRSMVDDFPEERW